MLVVAVVYMLGGVVYNRVRHQKTGVELFPNLPFWKALPGTIKVSERANNWSVTYTINRRGPFWDHD